MTNIVVGFDLDMTLIDSRPGVIASFSALNRELGTDIDGPLIASRLGPTLESEMAAYFAADEIAAVCDRYRAHYAELGPPGCSLLPGAAEAVAAVRTQSGTTLVVTAKFEPNARLCLDHVGIGIDHVVGWRHGPQKAETLQQYDADVYVGDTQPDIEAARVAGVHAVGVASGPVDRAGLAAAGADIVFDSLLEFPAWLRDFCA
ncbi:MAG: HAD family hydrolase [Acidimicrobiia bacterium]